MGVGLRNAGETGQSCLVKRRGEEVECWSAGKRGLALL